MRSQSGVFGWCISVGSFAAATGLSAWLGYYAMFNYFGAWDDEGYMLIALKAFAHHGGLYTHVSSQYGPFYFEAFSTIFSWLPMTHDNGRVVTLIVALLASLGIGVAIKMLTGNVLAGVATQVGASGLFISFDSESMHPSILVCFLFAVALIALALVGRGRRSVGCTVLGATVAALLLTQVNAGVFAAIAVLFSGLTMAPPGRVMRVLRSAVAALFIATPFILLWVAGGHRIEAWAVEYALVVALAAAGVVVMTLDSGFQGLVDRRDAYRVVLGGGVLGTVVLLIALVSGTRPIDLVRGAFLGPANQANVYTIPLRLPTWVALWGVACVAGAVWYRRYRLRSARVGLLEASVHLTAGLLILYCALAQTQITIPSMTFVDRFTVALPLLFLAALPPVGATESEFLARVAAVALALLEGFLAFPVAGSQRFWASLLIVPAGMLCLHDGARQLSPALAVTRRRWCRVGSILFATVLVLGGVAWSASVFVGNLSAEASTYNANTPTTLPGSHMIRLPAAQALTLESLSKAIHAQCSTFVTLPGMNSFYFWTEETPPTWFNTNSWFFLVNDAQQEKIVQRIEEKDRSRFCVVDNPDELFRWEVGAASPVPPLPLVRLVDVFEQENSPPKLFGGYQLFVSRGRAP